MARRCEILLEYQNVIESPPVQPDRLYGQACSNDAGTVDSWRQTWIDQFKENHKTYGPFKDRSIGKFFKWSEYKPMIVAGAGPSLKVNVDKLKDRKGIGLISCLHNFHFFEDNQVYPDFYVTLDSGPITIEEVYEGGKEPPDYYWEKTKNHKLFAYTASHPELLKKWQGEIYFFSAPVPDALVTDETHGKTEPFFMNISSGGNVLGASMYIAKGVLGANPVAFVGADFSFSYEKRFHPFDSKYDKNLGMVLKAVDVYGNKVLTWQSYYNFKCWFDYASIKLPGTYFNCTEGGILGAYAEGNISTIRMIDLVDFINMYTLHHQLKSQCTNPEIVDKRILI